MKYNTRFSTAFATMLVILSIISIKMAFLYGAELLLFVAVILPMLIAILIYRSMQREDYENE